MTIVECIKKVLADSKEAKPCKALTKKFVHSFVRTIRLKFLEIPGSIFLD